MFSQSYVAVHRKKNHAVHKILCTMQKDKKKIANFIFQFPNVTLCYVCDETNTGAIYIISSLFFLLRNDFQSRCSVILYHVFSVCAVAEL